jgi:acetyl esterase/lipase
MQPLAVTLGVPVAVAVFLAFACYLLSVGHRLKMAILRGICRNVDSCLSRTLVRIGEDESLDLENPEKLRKLRVAMDDFMNSTASGPATLPQGLAPNADFLRICDFSAPARDGHKLLVRAYVPNRKDAPQVAFIYYHGGGFCLGSLRGYDHVCRAVAKHTGAARFLLGRDRPAPVLFSHPHCFCHIAGFVVFYVDYRLAPEVSSNSAGRLVEASVICLVADLRRPLLAQVRFPVPLHDSYDALLWVAEHSPVSVANCTTSQFWLAH